MRDAINALLAPMNRRVRMMLGRAIVKLVDDSQKLQEMQLQGYADQVTDLAEHFQPYGFTSVPQPGAEAIVGAIGGSSSHTVVLVVDDRRYRLKNMAPGEVAIYTDQGDYVWIKRGGDMEVKAATKVVITSPLVEMSQDLHVKGSVTCDNDVSDSKGSMQKMRDQYNASTASASGDGLMADIATLWNSGGWTGDYAIASPGLQQDAGLETAVILSLFTDRRAGNDDVLPDGTDDRRGWWGDAYADDTGDQIGSRLWLLARSKQLQSVVSRAQQYAKEALQWLVDDGIASAVDVVASIVRQGVLGLSIAITRAKSAPVKYRFELFWGAQHAA